GNRRAGERDGVEVSDNDSVVFIRRGSREHAQETRVRVVEAAAQLFAKLAGKRAERRFARVDLAAGQHEAAGVALADQQGFAVRVADHGGGDLNRSAHV